MILDDDIKRLIQKLIADDAGLHDGMLELIVHVASDYGKAPSAALPVFDWDEDAGGIRDWIVEVLTADPPEEDISAYWFELFEAVVNHPDEVLPDDGRERQPQSMLSISGSTRFDFGREVPDWATLADDSYVPAGRFCVPYAFSVIKGIGEGSARNREQLPGAADALARAIVTLQFGYAAMAVRVALRAVDPVLTIGRRGRRAVAIGLGQTDRLALPTLVWEPPILN